MSATTADADAKFKAALDKDAASAPIEPPDVPAPPRRDPDAGPDAPFGRDEHGEPIAPHGVRNADGKPRLKPPGPGRDRKGGADAPRVGATLAKNYAPQVGELLDGIWMLGSSIPVPAANLATRVQCQAAILKANQPALTSGIAGAAQHNEMIASGVDKLTSGTASWILPAMFGLTPFVAQSALMWRSPLDSDVQALADRNRAQWHQFVQDATKAAGPPVRAVPAAVPQETT
jgi:hypothetical protein